MSSVVAEDGVPGLSSYGAAKASLHGLTRTLCKELGPAGILVNVVMPGTTLTERMSASLPDAARRRREEASPIQRLLPPEEVVPMIVFLCGGKHRRDRRDDPRQRRAALGRPPPPPPGYRTSETSSPRSERPGSSCVLHEAARRRLGVAGRTDRIQPDRRARPFRPPGRPHGASPQPQARRCRTPAASCRGVPTMQQPPTLIVRSSPTCGSASSTVTRIPAARASAAAHSRPRHCRRRSDPSRPATLSDRRRTARACRSAGPECRRRRRAR